MSANGPYRLLVAGGKTGGHLFPGIAVAKKFLALDPENKTLFVGTKDGIEAKVIPREGYPIRFVNGAGIRGRGILGAVKGLALIPIAMFQTFAAVASFKPHVALGVGGFVSGPAMIAAWIMRVPTAIQEQNAIPGWTNKVLAKFVDVVFASFEESSKYFPARKAIVVGNPVRDDLMKAVGEPELHLENLNPDLKTIFVFGGSQGARPINRAVLDFLRSNPTIRDGVNVIHQTGQADYEDVRREYAEMGHKAVVAPFIHKMGEAYGAADIVVARAGAGTAFEIMAFGKASVLIPFPQAAGDHQTFNAATLASKGAAVMVRQSEIQDGALNRALKDLLNDPGKLADMREKARSMAKNEAAASIAAKLVEMAAGKNKRTGDV